MHNFACNVWKTIKYSIEIMRIHLKNSKRKLILDIVIGLIQEASALLNMFFPAVILQLILDPNGMNKAIWFMFIVCLLLTLFGLILDVLRRLLSKTSVRAVN
mgnify:FL=1